MERKKSEMMVSTVAENKVVERRQKVDVFTDVHVFAVVKISGTRKLTG